MIEVKMKNMTGSEIITANLFPESGLVCYQVGDKELYNHVMNLSAKGWEIYTEKKTELKAPTIEQKDKVAPKKKTRNSK